MNIDAKNNSLMKSCKKNQFIFDVGVCILGILLIGYIIIKDKVLCSLEKDVAPLSYSLFVHAIDSLKNGNLSLWNSTIWGGFPAYAHPTSESLYPINWLLCLIFNNKEAGFVSYKIMGASYFLHLSLYYISVYALSKRIKLSKEASAFAAIIATFCLSLLNMRSFVWNIATCELCYCPLLLFFCIGIINATEIKKSRINAIGLGITLGLSALLSLSGLFFINAFFVALMCIFKLVSMIFAKDYSQ